MANTPSAYDQFVINNPVNPGDITLHSLPNPQPGAGGLPSTLTLWWYSVGKLILGIFWTDSGGAASLFSDAGGTNAATSDKLAALMGVPSINTYYSNMHVLAASGAVETYSYHGGTWHLNSSVGGDQGVVSQFLTN